MAIVVPHGYGDVVFIEARVRLTFWAALRALFGGAVDIGVSVYCKVPPQEVRTNLYSGCGEHSAVEKSVSCGHEVVSYSVDRFDGTTPVPPHGGSKEGGE